MLILLSISNDFDGVAPLGVGDSAGGGVY